MSAAPGGGRPDVRARRPQAVALVAQLADPDRGWDAIVIGEYERAFYANQYASMAPLPGHYGIGLWMPEAGGRVDWHAALPSARVPQRAEPVDHGDHPRPVYRSHGRGPVAAVGDLHTIGGSIIWVDIIPWFCLGWLALGVVLALVLRRGSPEKYEVLGRMVNAGLD
jgi:hypothetical protein